MEALRRAVDRRRDLRRAPECLGWKPDAILRPGLPVLIVNVSARGALVVCHDRIRPGHRAELQVHTLEGDDRRAVIGRIGRCRVVALEPLRFEGAIEFEAPVGAGSMRSADQG